MTAPILLAALLGVLIGGMLFFAIAVAPTVFRTLPAGHAGSFLRALFPRYYAWGLAVAILCTLGAIATGAASGVSAACGLVAILFVYARQHLMPRINRARDLELDGDTDAGLRFRWLHRQSVAINLLQLLLLVAAAIYLAIS